MLLSSHDGLSGTAIERSELSHAFEAFYRALPVDGGVMPNRSVFRPERAAKFLKHIVLCEAVTEGAGGLLKGSFGAMQFGHALASGVATGTLEMQLNMIARDVIGGGRK